MKKLLFVFAALLLALAPCEISAAPAARPSTPKGFAIDPEAVALFDRAAKLYGECQTIRMRWISRNESSISAITKKLVETTIVFVRPSKSKVQIKNGAISHAIYLVDGQLDWSLENVSSAVVTYSKEIVNKDSTPLENALLNLAFPTDAPGPLLYDWLRGEHLLQPAQITMLKQPHFNMVYFEAKKLAPAIWKGRSWQRVQIHQRFGPAEDTELSDYDPSEDAIFNHIYWLAPDNTRLVRIQELGKNGKINMTQEIVEQTFNAAIPASTFILKIPRGAKKE